MNALLRGRRGRSEMCQQPPEARREARHDFSLRASGKKPPWEPQTNEEMSFCCWKPPALWSFVSLSLRLIQALKGAWEEVKLLPLRVTRAGSEEKGPAIGHCLPDMTQPLFTLSPSGNQCRCDACPRPSQDRAYGYSLIEGMGKARLGPAWEVLEKTLQMSCPWAVQLMFLQPLKKAL